MKHFRLMSSTDADNYISQNWHKKMGFKEIGMLNDLNTSGEGELFLLKQLI
jgi:L-amino acid N-acyltransferase YncA